MRVTEIHPGGLESMKIVDRPEPQAGPGEVLVRWRATSLNFHDYLVAIGAIPVPEGRIPMSDGAGEIVAVGEGVEQWQAGDKVMSLFFPNWIEGRPTGAKTRGIAGETLDGCMAELAVVPAASLTAIPEGYSFAEAATLPCAAVTAWRGLVEEGGLRPGEKVLIEGTGGMSLFGMQIALAAGARVFATTSSPEKAERLKAMGVEAVVNYREDERWGKAIYKLSGGGVDHVLDVGGGSTMQQSIEAAAMGGHLVSIGILGDGRKGAITFPKFFFKHQRMTGIAVGSRVMQEAMVASINVSGWKPIIDHTFKFEELADAFRHQATGAHFGKIVVEI